MVKFLKKVSFVYMYDTPWLGNQFKKLYLQSGQFTATLKTSQTVISWDTLLQGISWDGNNTPWVGNSANKLFLISGQFSATMKDSQSVAFWDIGPSDISWDGINTPWVGLDDDKLYLQSGQFTSTLKTSEDVSGVDTASCGISYDGGNTPWVGNTADKLYHTSGQFTSTIKDSEAVNGVDATPNGISWDGTNTPWSGNEANKLYLTSGQFTSTLKDSVGVVFWDDTPTGICTNDILGRLTGVEKYVTDSLTISDQIDLTVIYTPTPAQIITDNLVISQGVLGYLDYIPVIDPLVITDAFTITLSSIEVFDYLEIIDDAYVPSTYNRSIVDSFTITDSITISQNAYPIEQTLSLQQFVDLDTEGYLERERLASNELVISDSVSVDTTGYAFKIIDSLTISDSIDETVPRLFVVEDTLTLIDTPDGVFQHNITIEDEFDVLYIDTDNLIVYRIMDTVERHLTANRTPLNFLTIQQNVQVVNEITGATEDTASNTLTITDEATVARSLGNSITISDNITVTQGQLIKVNLTITDTVGIIKEVNKQPSDNLVLKLTVDYTHIKTHTHHEYKPFIGVTTDPDAPTPPSLSEPSRTVYTNVRLSYPITSPTDILTLDGPELNNRDQLHFTRINRETRGGTLVVFAAANWPKREQFNLQFIGLSETESQDILNFLRDTLGKQIKLRDWEGNERTVITLTPDNPIVRDGFCKNTVDLDFESVL